MSRLAITASDVKHIVIVNRMIEESGFKLNYSSISAYDDETGIRTEREKMLKIDREFFAEATDGNEIMTISLRYSSEET